MTAAQLTSLKGVIRPISQVPQSVAQTNSMYRDLDLNITYPFKFNKFREGLSSEPGIAFYNLGNMDNFGTYTGTLQNIDTVQAAGVTDPTVNTAVGSAGYINGIGGNVNMSKRTFAWCGYLRTGRTPSG